MTIELSGEIKKAISVLNVINQGVNNKEIQARMKLQALLEGRDAPKVRHLATRYTTDSSMYPATQFSKEFVAPNDTDYELILEHHSSNKFFSVKINDGSSLILNETTLKTADSNSIMIPAGAKATIEFPMASSQLKYTGWLTAGLDLNNLDAFDWIPLEAALDMSVFQVYGSGNAMMFVTDDESVWGMGKKVQGGYEDGSQLKRLELPHNCRNFKKVI